MSTEATCTFQVKSWDEKPYEEFGGGAKLTRARVTQAYRGAIEGEGSVEYLMSYTVDGTASFVGIELVKGVVAGRSGSFIIRHVGTFEGGKARSAWVIVGGSGTGELAALRGEGNYVVGHGEAASVTFRYSFD
jgi:hypothetical protein